METSTGDSRGPCGSWRSSRNRARELPHVGLLGQAEESASDGQ